MRIRAATVNDADALARIHVQSWAETYPGLLPKEEIAAHTYDQRLVQWQDALSRRTTRIVLADGAGFAQVGPQRDAGHRADYPDELYALYTLGAAQGRGLGRALLRAALGETPRPFTAVMLAANHRAHAFYTRMGGVVIGRAMGSDGFEDLIFGWRASSDVQASRINISDP